MSNPGWRRFVVLGRDFNNWFAEMAEKKEVECLVLPQKRKK